jgi:hypothetical protein
MITFWNMQFNNSHVAVNKNNVDLKKPIYNIKNLRSQASTLTFLAGGTPDH